MQNQGRSQGTPSPQAVPQDDHLGKVVCGHEAGFAGQWAWVRRVGEPLLQLLMPQPRHQMNQAWKSLVYCTVSKHSGCQLPARAQH